MRPTLEIARRVSTFEEVTGGLDETDALYEARRCLSCGNCFECDNFGDQYFSSLDGTWAGGVLSSMRTHYESRQEARRIHAARQGVKQRDWTG